MKKMILLFLTVFTFLFGFLSKPKAVYMYVDCEYTNECSTAGNDAETIINDAIILLTAGVLDVKNFHFFNGCKEAFNVYVPVTDDDGNVSLMVYFYDPIQSSVNGYKNSGGSFRFLENDYKNSDGSRGCWLKNSSYAFSCTPGNTLDKSPSQIFVNGICPSGILEEKGIDLLDQATNITITRLIEEFIKERTSSTPTDWEYIPFGEGGRVKNNLADSKINRTEYILYSFENNSQFSGTAFIAEGYKSDGAYLFTGPAIVNFFGKGDIAKYQAKMIEKQGEKFWRVHDTFESRMIASNMKVNAGGAANYITSLGSFFIGNAVGTATGIPTLGSTLGISALGFTAINASSLDYNVCQGMTETECRNTYNYKTIISSNTSDKESNDTKSRIVRGWYDDAKDGFGAFKDLNEIIKKQSFMDTTNAVVNANENADIYNFSGSASSVEDLITNLEKSYPALLSVYKTNGFRDYAYTDLKYTNASSSLLSYFYAAYNLKLIDDISNGKNNVLDVYASNAEYIQGAISRDLNSTLKDYINDDSKIDIFNLSDSAKEYTKLFYTVTMILDSKSVEYGLTGAQKNRISTLRDNFEKMIDDFDLNIFPAVDCESVVGAKLIEKIKKYINVFRIAIPIVLMVFGIIDFTKAIFAGDEEKMKKSQKDFIKRVGIAILIFLVPSIVKLLLVLANKVWPFISHDTCKLFDI